MNPTNRTATRKALGWLTAAALAAAGAVGLGVGLVSPAAALQTVAGVNMGPLLGAGTLVPATGAVTLAPRATTTVACPSTAAWVDVYVDSTAAGLNGAVTTGSDTSALTTLTTSGVAFGLSLLDTAATQGRTLVNGNYDITIGCSDGFGGYVGHFDLSLTVSGAPTATSAGTTFTFNAPAGPTATTTAISAVPASTAVQGANVTLNATVAPSTAAGTVQFQDVVTGTPVNVGAPATVTAGSASVTVSNLTVGAHTLRAVFTPTNATAFSGSTSATLAYTITAPPATATTTTFAASPASTAVAGATVTLTGTVSPANAVGTIQFEDTVSGTPVNVGTPVTVTGGTATATTTSLTVGAHQLRARFIPANAANFTASTSAATAYTITAPPTPPTTTTTTVAASPAATATAGSPVTFTATVAPSTAVGSVQFQDVVTGTPVNVGAAVAVSGGTASVTVSNLTVGSHSIQAVFTPTNAANFTPSTSAALAYAITAPPAVSTTTTIAASPATTAPQGSPVTFTATVAPATAVGSVQFQDVVTGTPVNVGNSVAVSGGTASVTVSNLTVGSHSVRAVFTPTNVANFTGSTSANLAYTITAVVQPPATTTTTIAASPADTAPQGTAVTLTATLSPAAAAGTVQFRDTVGATTVNLGTPVAVTGGTATFSTSSLAVGQHSFTAVFTPTDAAAFTGSTSTPLPYTVTAVVQPPASTSTSVTASPAATAVAGAPVTFTATVTPTAAGTVQFSDTVGGTPVAIGAPVPVTNGSASVSTSTLAVGAHQVVAAFTPADATAFAGSTSAPLAYTITAAGGNEGAAATTLVLKAKAIGDGREARERRDGQGHDEFFDDDDRCDVAAAAKLVARVAPRGAAGTVQFFDTFNGTTTPVGGPVAVQKNGKARTVAGPLAAGTHVFTAVFTPADPTKFAGSTSNDAPVTIKARKAG